MTCPGVLGPWEVADDTLETAAESLCSRTGGGETGSQVPLQPSTPTHRLCRARAHGVHRKQPSPKLVTRTRGEGGAGTRDVTSEHVGAGRCLFPRRWNPG